MESISSLPSSKRDIDFAGTSGRDAKRLRRSSTNEGDEYGRVADASGNRNALQKIVVTAEPSPIGDLKTQRNKISILRVCQMLESGSGSENPGQKTAEHMSYGTTQSALYKCVGQLVRPFLMKRCVKGSQCESTISAQKCADILDDLDTLKVDLSSMPTNNMFNFHASKLFKPFLEQSFDDETRYIDALSSFIDRTSKMLNLWKTLCECQLSSLFAALTQDQQNVLVTCRFRGLINLRVDPCVLLIKLTNSCMNESTTVNSNSSKFRKICSIWSRHLLDEVMEVIRSTQTRVDYREREEKVSMALQWFEPLVAHIELNDFLDELLTITNRSAGNFLIRSVLMAPDNVELVNVLWKYYKRNGRHSAATKIFDELSSVPNAHQNLSDRIEYLESAVNDGHCFGNGISMRNIADTLEVARVQKMILDSLSKVSIHDAQLACGRLNQQLYTIDQLTTRLITLPKKLF